MSLLVPVFTEVQNGVARAFSSPKVALRLSRSASRRETKAAPPTAIGERPVGVDELPQAHVGGAECEGRAVEVASLAQAFEAEVSQSLCEYFVADETQRSHGGDVERRGKRGAHADEAEEPLVVVLGPVEPARNQDLNRAVLDEGGRRDETLVEGEGVEERLERRACLAPGPDAIDPACARRVTRAADVGEHASRGVIHDEDGAVLDVLGTHRSELGQERVCGEPLEWGIERR